MKNWFGFGKGSSATSSDKRCLFPQEQVRLIRSMLTAGIDVHGAELCAAGGLMIDGHVSGSSSIKTSDNSMIAISSRGQVSDSVIEATDLLIEGQANAVVMVVTGRVEFGPAAVVVGTLYKGPHAEVYVAPTADVQDLTIKPMRDAVQASIRKVAHG